MTLSPAGVGKITGRLRDDIAPGLYDLTCTIPTCGAGWVGEPGEWCTYCAVKIDEMVEEQRKLDRVNGYKFDANGDTPSPDVDTDLRAMLLNWPAFWMLERAEAEWIAEPIIPAKRSVALFAPGGTGKSLLALWLAAAIATGRPVFGRANPPIDVLYLDYEMTADDLAERLEAMGYGPDDDLSRLHYALLPSLPGLDQPEGGKAVTRLAQLCEATLVVVDTFGRAAHGDENEADTVRNWYRWTGLHLKAEGRAFIRIDHAGKDLGKGQRGSSAKNDDVDVVWQMTRQDGDTFQLKATKRRMSWIPETVDLLKREDPVMVYALLSGITYPAGTAECVRRLDELDVAVDAGYRTAADALRDAGHPTRAALIRGAQRSRREAIQTFDNTNVCASPGNLGRTPDAQCVPDNGTHPIRNTDLPGADSLRDAPGRTSEPRGVRPPLFIADAPQADLETPQLPDLDEDF